MLARRFDGAPLIVRANTKTHQDATAETLAGALRSVARTIDPAHDILLLMLTSHGSHDGLAVKGGRRSDTLSPAALRSMLGFTDVRHRIVPALGSGSSLPGLLPEQHKARLFSGPRARAKERGETGRWYLLSCLRNPPHGSGPGLPQLRLELTTLQKLPDRLKRSRSRHAPTRFNRRRVGGTKCNARLD